MFVVMVSSYQETEIIISTKKIKLKFLYLENLHNTLIVPLSF